MKKIQSSFILKGAIIGLFTLAIFSCSPQSNQVVSKQTNSMVKVAGAMKRVMRKGELDGIIGLDSIKPKQGLYGIGPVSYLRGEILINAGKTYVSHVKSDSTMIVEETDDVMAPFFVYGHVEEWNVIDLPKSIRTLKDLETFLGEQKKELKQPFIFKVIGQVDTAKIHIQNLPKGTQVRSPKEAHQGQVKYTLEAKAVEIIGFYSTAHQGVFTHHDAFTHMHLITKDKRAMGHLDAVVFSEGQVQLYLPL